MIFPELSASLSIISSPSGEGIEQNKIKLSAISARGNYLPEPNRIFRGDLFNRIWLDLPWVRKPFLSL
jgi:hypothetical protein